MEVNLTQEEESWPYNENECDYHRQHKKKSHGHTMKVNLTAAAAQEEES